MKMLNVWNRKKQNHQTKMRSISTETRGAFKKLITDLKQSHRRDIKNTFENLELVIYIIIVSYSYISVGYLSIAISEVTSRK